MLYIKCIHIHSMMRISEAFMPNQESGIDSESPVGIVDYNWLGASNSHWCVFT